MSASEISYLIELNKKKAEFEYKKGYLLRKGVAEDDPKIVALGHEIDEITSQANMLQSKIMTKINVIFYPNENALEEMSKEIAALDPCEVDKALESKQGEIYALLEKRGKIVKENYERRRDIAVLIEFVNSLPSNIRDEIVEQVRAGKIEKIDASILDEKTRLKLFKFLNRAGIPCCIDNYLIIPVEDIFDEGKGLCWREVRVEINGNWIWVEPEKETEAKNIAAELAETSKMIQIMNTERQIRKFSAEEEKKFSDLQKKYVVLLRKRDELIAE